MMPNSGEYFLSQAQNYAPVASGLAPTFSSGFEGLPFTQDNPMLGMLGGPLLSGLFAKAGYAPMGLGHDRNVYDTLQAQRYQRQMMDLQKKSAEMDRDSWISTMRGIAHMTGTPWGAEQMRASRSLTDAMVNASPMLNIMMPDMMDEMAGPSGSEGVMAGKMMSAGRYRIDPVTGRMGQDPEQVQALSSQMFKDLYVAGGGRDTQGFSAGQIGGLYEQLALRGMLKGSRGSPLDRLGGLDSATLRDAASRQNVDIGDDADVKNLSPSNTEKMLGDSEISKKLQSFDATKTTNSLKGYLKAVAAVRDIFGDLGRPNAPMSELLNALEQLTNGSVGQVNPGRLDSMVRMTHQLAQTTGVSLDAALMLQQHASSRAAQLGVEPIFGVQATQGALAFGGAFRAGGYGADPAWGKYTADQMQQLDANLRVNAAASRQANRFGLALRLGETYNYDSNTEAGGLIAGLRSAKDTGQDSFTFKGADGKEQTRKFSDVSEGEFLRIFGDPNNKTGLNQHDVESMLGQKFANRQYVESGGITGIVRQNQMDGDVKPWLQRTLGGFLAGELGRHGITGDDQSKAAVTAANAAAGRILDLDPSTFANDDQRRKAMGGIFQEELGKTEGGRKLVSQLTKNGEDPTKFFQATSESFKGYWDQTIKYSPDLAYLGNSQNMFLAFNKPLQQQANRITQGEQFSAEIRSALTPLNRGGMLRRAVGYLQRVGEDKGANDNELYGLVAETLGGVSIDDVKSRVAPVMTDVNKEKEQLESLQKQFAAAGTDTQRTDLSKQIRTHIQTLQTVSTHAQQTLEAMGIDSNDDPLNVSDTNMALNLVTRQDRYTEQVDKAFNKGSGTPEERNKRLDDFFANPEGKTYAETVIKRGQANESVAEKLLLSDTSVRMFGNAGIEQAKTIKDSNERLREMAFEYAGGSIEHLMAGRLDPAIKDADQVNRIRSEAATVSTRGSEAVAEIHRMQEQYTKPVSKGGGKRQWGDLDQLSTKLGKSRQAVGLAYAASETEARDMGHYQELLDVKKNRKPEDMNQTFVDNLESSKLQVKKFADRMNVSVDTAMGATDVYKEMYKQAEGERTKHKMTGDDLATAMLDEYGLKVDTKTEGGKAKIKSLSDVVQTEHGREITSSLIRGHQDLVSRGRGKGYGGADNNQIFMSMFNEYGNMDRKAFADKYGEAGAAEMDLQSASGMFAFDKDKKTGKQVGRRLVDDAADVGGVYGARLNGGDLDHGGRAMKVEIPDGMTIRITGGDLKISEDGRATVSAGGVSAGKDHAASGG
jgi:CRISPR type IV-associated protein Csf3